MRVGAGRAELSCLSQTWEQNDKSLCSLDPFDLSTGRNISFGKPGSFNYHLLPTASLGSTCAAKGWCSSFFAEPVFGGRLFSL